MTQPDNEKKLVYKNDTPLAQPLQKSAQRRRRHASRRFSRIQKIVQSALSARWILLVIPIILIVLATSEAVLIIDGINRLDSNRRSLERVLDIIAQKDATEYTLNDFERLEIATQALTDGVASLQFRMGLIRPLRILNSDLDVSLTLLSAAEKLSLASLAMLDGTKPTLILLLDSETNNTISIPIGERIIDLLSIGQSSFTNAAKQLDAANQQLETLNLNNTSPAILLNAGKVHDFHSQLQNINDLLLNTPDILRYALGTDQTRTYLILGMNNDILRTVGGEPQTWGWLSLRSGSITGFDYTSFVATPFTPPPDNSPILRQFSAPTYWVDTQNADDLWQYPYSADFAIFAAMTSNYYDAGENPFAPLTGVISIDLDGYEIILEAMGSVDITDYDILLTAENFRETLYNYKGNPRDYQAFIHTIYRAILENWQSMGRNPKTQMKLLRAALEGLQKKHILLYLRDENFNGMLQVLGWAGEQHITNNHDYFMVTDTNTSNASNRYIFRQITYDVTVNTDSTLSSRLTIAYDYPSTSNETTPPALALTYQNFLQVFLPAGSLETGRNFDNQTGFVSADERNNNTVIVSQFNVEYGNAERLQYRYTPPIRVENYGSYKRYRLLIQKQPGTRLEDVLVQITLPPESEVVSVTPEVTASYEIDQPILDFRLEMDSDQWLEIIYSE